MLHGNARLIELGAREQCRAAGLDEVGIHAVGERGDFHSGAPDLGRAGVEPFEREARVDQLERRRGFALAAGR